MLKIVTYKSQISSVSAANGVTVVRTDYPNNFYWSSTEYNNTTIVLRINTTGGPPGYGWNKNLTYRVRTVRAF